MEETLLEGQAARVLRFCTNDPAVLGETQARTDTAKERLMQVSAETEVDDHGVERLRRFWLDGRKIEVIDNLDQWHGADHHYLKVRGSDGNVYILRLDEVRGEWELTMYQRAQMEDALLSPKVVRPPRRRVTM